MRFAERELKEYAEPVSPDQLQQEKSILQWFLDEDGLVANRHLQMVARGLFVPACC
jgi:hypothetical protein